MDTGAIIALVISAMGLVIAVLTFFYSRNNDKFYRKIEEARRQEEIERKNKEKKLNRPQLKTIFFEFDSKKLGYKKEDDYDIDVFFLPYKNLDVDESNYTPLYEQKIKKHLNGTTTESIIDSKVLTKGKKFEKRPICKYQDVYNKKDEWISWKIHLKNVGKSNIVFYYLLTCMEESGSIINNKHIDYYNAVVMNNSCQFTSTGDRNFILIDDEIKIKISFHKDFIASDLYSAPFVLHMETEDNNYWAQGLFLNKNETNISYEIDGKEFSNYYKGKYLDAVMYDRVYWDKNNSSH